MSKQVLLFVICMLMQELASLAFPLLLSDPSSQQSQRGNAHIMAVDVNTNVTKNMESLEDLIMATHKREEDIAREKKASCQQGEYFSVATGRCENCNGLCPANMEHCRHECPLVFLAIRYDLEARHKSSDDSADTRAIAIAGLVIACVGLVLFFAYVAFKGRCNLRDKSNSNSSPSHTTGSNKSINSNGKNSEPDAESIPLTETKETSVEDNVLDDEKPMQSAVNPHMPGMSLGIIAQPSEDSSSQTTHLKGHADQQGPS